MAFTLITQGMLCMSLSSFASVNQKPVLKIPIRYMPKLNKFLGNEVEQNKVFHNISNRLVELNQNLKPMPGLGTWKVNFKSKCINFDLKEKYFSNLDRLTSKDIQQNIVSAVEKSSTINRILVQDQYFILTSKYRFNICLKSISSAPVLINALSTIEFSITKKDKSGFPIGTGNYKITHMNDKKIVLSSSNEKSTYSKIELKVTNSEDSYELLKKGLINETFNIGQEYIGIDKGINSKTFNIGSLGLVLNTHKGCFHKLKNRLILRDAIYDYSIHNISKSQTIADSLIPQGYLGHRATPIRRSIGIKKLECKLSIVLRQKYQGSIQEKYLNHIMNYLKVKYSISYDSFGSILKRLRQSVDIDMTLKVDIPGVNDPSKTFISYKTKSKQNVTNYSNTKLDALLEKYHNQASAKKKFVIVKKLTQEIYDDSPVIPIQAFLVTRYNNINDSNRYENDYRFWSFNYDKN
jgi:MarR-like DNA-binding transcriptional regulator SgrR of sgrS sRNA